MGGPAVASSKGKDLSSAGLASGAAWIASMLIGTTPGWFGPVWLVALLLRSPAVLCSPGIPWYNCLR
ncbi:hypothetical protein RRF57_010236 [Xylaria bambusicola]|uniref:Uncharacterized protein n=1 Tax=Xylaria bambusicola TaxID=326684 RepID=A0AAN7ZCV5_9PEZI